MTADGGLLAGTPAEAAAERAEDSAPPPVAPPVPPVPVTVLLVEDSAPVRAIVQLILQTAGHRVLEAVDGATAVAMCAIERPDVVLLDVEMPGMDGWDVLAALKRNPELADTPVVFLTGRHSTADMVQGLRLGAHDYLRKPCHPAELLARVHAASRVKRLQDELHERNALLDAMSRTDVLTGLRNRRHAEEHLSAAASLARRSVLPVAVSLIDIDHFKRVNDEHGHDAGDAVLRQVARCLEAHSRAEDLIGRWGGEEFIGILPQTSAQQAGIHAERLRRAVAAETCELPGGGGLTMTVSVGCASTISAGVPSLLRSADSALYVAKAAGRNRVVVAEDDGAAPHVTPPSAAVSSD